MSLYALNTQIPVNLIFYQLEIRNRIADISWFLQFSFILAYILAHYFVNSLPEPIPVSSIPVISVI